MMPERDGTGAGRGPRAAGAEGRHRRYRHLSDQGGANLGNPLGSAFPGRRNAGARVLRPGEFGGLKSQAEAGAVTEHRGGGGWRRPRHSACGTALPPCCERISPFLLCNNEAPSLCGFHQLTLFLLLLSLQVIGARPVSAGLRGLDARLQAAGSEGPGPRSGTSRDRPSPPCAAGTQEHDPRARHTRLRPSPAQPGWRGWGDEAEGAPPRKGGQSEDQVGTPSVQGGPHLRPESRSSQEAVRPGAGTVSHLLSRPHTLLSPVSVCTCLLVRQPHVRKGVCVSVYEEASLLTRLR